MGNRGGGSVFSGQTCQSYGLEKKLSNEPHHCQQETRALGKQYVLKRQNPPMQETGANGRLRQKGFLSKTVYFQNAKPLRPTIVAEKTSEMLVLGQC